MYSYIASKDGEKVIIDMSTHTYVHEYTCTIIYRLVVHNNVCIIAITANKSYNTEATIVLCP